MITVLHEQRETQCSDASADSDALDGHAVEEATGWTWKPPRTNAA